jgi:predicted ATP-grasp superfamily ATP-dependent carboligase
MPHISRHRIVLYEYTCSGGLRGTSTGADAASLLREGWAMLRALAGDFAALPNTHVQVLADHRGLPGPLPNCELIAVDEPAKELEQLSRLAKHADWTIVIAPEFDRLLFDRASAVESHGARLLGPNTVLVELLSDKQATIEHLQRRGVPVPRGWLWRPGEALPDALPFPAVIKPNDGAGSQDTYLCSERSQLEDVLRSYRRVARIEQYIVGTPASVSFLCGPAGCFPLVPCLQRLQLDHQIRYFGGAMPLGGSENRRAIALATRAVQTLPQALGYIGVDLILGNDGATDCVIEINPRLTTSYVGLRAAARTNLAKAMLDIAEGLPPHLSFDARSVEFGADVTVRTDQLPPAEPRTPNPEPCA